MEERIVDTERPPCKFLMSTETHNSYCTFYLKKKVRPAWVDPVRLIRPAWCYLCTARQPKKEMK